MAKSLTNAAQIQLGIGQNQLNVYKQISDSARAVMDNAAQSIRDASNIWTSTVRSAQDYKQQQIDTFFKNEQLKLEDKRINNEALYRDDMINRQNASLDLEREALQIRREEAQYRIDSIQQGNKNKLYLDNLHKAAAQLNSESKLELSSIAGRETVIRDRLKNMSVAERLVSGKSLENELSDLSKKRDEANGKAAEAEKYVMESLHVSQGGTPTLKIPGYENLNNNINNSGLPSGDGGDIDTTLFPSPNPDAMREANQFRANIGINENEQDEGVLYGELPAGENYQNPLEINSFSDVPELDAIATPPTKPVIDRDTLIGALFSIPDDNVAEEAPAVIALADDETKAVINQMSKDVENGFLSSYGESIGYNVNNRSDDALNVIKKSMIDYKRLGGNEYKVAGLQQAANNAINRFRNELLSAKNEDGTDLFPRNAANNYKPEPETFYNAVQAKYQEWVLNREKQIQQSEQAQKEQAIKTGIAANGKLNAELAAGLSKDQALDTSKLSVESLFPSRSNSAALAQGNENRRQIIDDIESFRKQFVFNEGENKGMLKNSFASFVLDNRHKLPYNESDDPRQVAINEIRKASNNRSYALELWKKLKGKNQ